MSNVLDYEFEELPLVIHDGIEAGLTNGLASIEYDRDGEWWVTGVSVEGYQKLTLSERAAGKKPWIYVKAPTQLEDMISHRLENEWFDRVSEAVREQLARDGEDAREYNLEVRRDRLMGL